jgi:hypothetical protein
MMTTSVILYQIASIKELYTTQLYCLSKILVKRVFQRSIHKDVQLYQTNLGKKGLPKKNQNKIKQIVH